MCRSVFRGPVVSAVRYAGVAIFALLLECAPRMILTGNHWVSQKQRFTVTIWSRLRTWCSDMQQRENHVVFMWEEMKTPLSFCHSVMHQHVRKNHTWGRFPLVRKAHDSVAITDHQRMRTNLYCRTRHCSTSESTFPRPWSKSSLYGCTDPRICTSFLPPSIPPLPCSYPSHGSNSTRHKWTARNNADHFQIPTTTKRSCYYYFRQYGDTLENSCFYLNTDPGQDSNPDPARSLV